MNSKWIVERISFDGDCIYNTEEEYYYTYDKKDLERVCEILNNLETENLIQCDLIRQLKTVLMTDDRENFLKYRKKFIEVCEEIVKDGKIIKTLERENERLKKEISKYKEIYNER